MRRSVRDAHDAAMTTNTAMTEAPKLACAASASKWRRLRVWGVRTLAVIALAGVLGAGIVAYGVSTSPGVRRAGVSTSPGRTAVLDQEMEHGRSTSPVRR
jgi:hypothetical protein